MLKRKLFSWTLIFTYYVKQMSVLFIDTVLDSVTGSQDSSGGQVWMCIVIVCVCR